MTRRIKHLAALVLPGLLLAGSLWLERTSAPGPPSDRSGEADGTPENERRRGTRLDEDLRFLTWSCAAKSRITGEVIQRRRGLLEGAAALRAIDAYRPARLRPIVWGDYPSRSEEERYCRSLLGWVRGQLEGGGDDPARLAELEAELEEELGRPGAPRLPDVSLDRCLPPDLLRVPDGTTNQAGRR